MTDGPYSGFQPTSDDWQRMKFCTVLYVDKDGILSPGKTRHDDSPKPRDSYGFGQDSSFQNLGYFGKTHPPGAPTQNNDRETLPRTPEMEGPAGYGAIRPGDLPPAEFFANHFSEDSVMSSSSGVSSPGDTHGTIRLGGISEGTNRANAAGDTSSILPMELMIYNNLMMDIEGTTRFLGQEFQDSILFGPMSSPAPASQHSDQGFESQQWDTTHGLVLSPVHIFPCKC